MRAFRHPRLLALTALVLCGWGKIAHAQRDFFKSSPGSLSASHSHLDDQGNCNDCHDGGKEVAENKCLGCHDHHDLRDRIRAGKGYHSSAKVKRYGCGDCHPEHRGRSFDIMGWDSVGGSKGFDHKVTGWSLDGKHADVDCKECHKRKNRQGLRLFLGEDHRCGACHAGDQPHQFRPNRVIACERCHTAGAWKPPRNPMNFDHTAASGAAMPLVGRHAELKCEQCHPKLRFHLGTGKRVDCDSCHENKHKGQLFGQKSCAGCHSPEREKMSDVRFPHKPPITRFRLVGAHRKVRCESCHTADLGTRKPNQNCGADGCHGDDNPHGDRFDDEVDGGSCTACHSASSWKPTGFRHDRHTGFKLTGKHAKLGCRSCHRGKKKPFTFEKLDERKVRCTGCHAHENAHDGQFRLKSARAEKEKCLTCHLGIGDRRVTKEAAEDSHGLLSNWPLTKKHKGVPCASCHEEGNFDLPSKECSACHEDSLHRGRLGKKCSRCHMGGDWNPVRFDHLVSTKWPLAGWHDKVDDCAKCHPGRRYRGTPTTCKGCHAADDIHKGKLVDDCERCHRPSGKNTFDHNRQAHFKLRGAHQHAPCRDCHENVRFEPVARKCVGCHPAPKQHRGRYGENCDGCHNQNVFSDVAALHDVGSFTLGGAHDNLECTACHPDSRPLRGTGELCITCHRQDDIHANGLSPRCGTCHTQWSWAPARFDHSSVGCTPIGLHRTLPCNDCHKNGNYSAISAQCYSCHRDEALAVSEPDHSAFLDCGRCHNTSYWSNGSGTGPAHGRESICW